jgi:outer membrane protein insertion porin family
MKKSFIAFIVCMFVGVAALAQNRLRGYEVTSIRFEANKELNSDLLRTNITTEESPNAVMRFVSNYLSERLGGKIQFFNPEKFSFDYDQLKSFYLDQGFFHSTIDTSLLADAEAKTVDLVFKIFEGKRSMIDTIRIRGLAGMPQDFLGEVEGNRLIKVGDPFIKSLVAGELRRILSACVNSGYIYVRVDTLVTRRYASTNNISILFDFRPGSRYVVGKIGVLQDTSRAVIDPSIALKQLELSENEYYSEQRRAESEQNLNRLGIYESAKVEMIAPSPSDSTTTVPIMVNVRTRPLRELTPEIGADDENSAFNLVVGAGLNDRNFFGGARNFSLTMRLRLGDIQHLQWQNIFENLSFRDTTLIARAEVVASMTQPHFFSNKLTFTATLASIIDKRQDYYIPIVNARFGTTARFSYILRGSADWTLEWIRPTGLSPTGEARMKQELPDAFKAQANSIISLSLQHDRRNDQFNPSQGVFRSGLIEVSGLFAPFFAGIMGPTLTYSQYLKGLISSSWYWDPTEVQTLVWASRIRVGVATLFGNSPADVPLTRRFYGGGSSSIRGWNSRELGAMPVPTNGGTALLEASIESRWHLFRGEGSFWIIPIDKISLAFFLDVGNVWDKVLAFRPDQIAVAQGIGFRWDTVVGPVRIDFGWKVYDPKGISGHRVITQRQFVQETLSEIVFHLGIGNAF